MCDVHQLILNYLQFILLVFVPVQGDDMVRHGRLLPALLYCNYCDNLGGGLDPQGKDCEKNLHGGGRSDPLGQA